MVDVFPILSIKLCWLLWLCIFVSFGMRIDRRRIANCEAGLRIRLNIAIAISDSEDNSISAITGAFDSEIAHLFRWSGAHRMNWINGTTRKTAVEIEITDPQRNNTDTNKKSTHSRELKLKSTKTKRSEKAEQTPQNRKNRTGRTQLNSAKMNRIESSTAGLGLLARLCCQFGLISVSWPTAGVCKPSKVANRALLATDTVGHKDCLMGKKFGVNKKLMNHMFTVNTARLYSGLPTNTL